MLVSFAAREVGGPNSYHDNGLFSPAVVSRRVALCRTRRCGVRKHLIGLSRYYFRFPREIRRNGEAVGAGTRRTAHYYYYYFDRVRWIYIRPRPVINAGAQCIFHYAERVLRDIPRCVHIHRPAKRLSRPRLKPECKLPRRTGRAPTSVCTRYDFRFAVNTLACKNPGRANLRLRHGRVCAGGVPRFN